MNERRAPDAQVVLVRLNPMPYGGPLVTVACPYCHEDHTHGIEDVHTIYARHRIPHCTSLRPDAAAGYWFEITRSDIATSSERNTL